MEIMRHIKNVYEKKGLLHYIYYYAPTLIFLIFFICEWSASEFDMSIISILKHSVFHILLLIVVYIWLRVTPYYYDYLHSLENVFEDNPEYKEEYSKFVHRAEQFNLSYSSKSSWLKVIYLNGRQAVELCKMDGVCRQMLSAGHFLERRLSQCRSS